MIIELIAGILLAVPFVAYARRQGPRVETRIYALGLIGAAVIYAGFALVGTAEPRWMAIEFAGLLPFAGLTWLGLRHSTWWLAAGWVAHAAWDTGLHLVTGTPPFVPSWYPVVCIGFDGFVAGAITLQAWRALAAETA